MTIFHLIHVCDPKTDVFFALVSKLQIFEKNSKSNFSKTIEPTLLKFGMCVHVGPRFIHAKFHDPGGYRTAYIAKNLNFGFFEQFLSIFCKKMVVKIQPGIQNFA